jgi:glutamyl/glutaminyl-tRNA synthetase
VLDRVLAGSPWAAVEVRVTALSELLGCSARAQASPSIRAVTDGLPPHEIAGEPDKGAYGPYTQMARLSLYSEWAEKLIRAGTAYRCYCTKAEV